MGIKWSLLIRRIGLEVLKNLIQNPANSPVPIFSFFFCWHSFVNFDGFRQAVWTLNLFQKEPYMDMFFFWWYEHFWLFLNHPYTLTAQTVGYDSDNNELESSEITTVNPGKTKAKPMSKPNKSAKRTFVHIVTKVLRITLH